MRAGGQTLEHAVVPATLLTDTTPDMTLYDNEIFGAVTTVLPADGNAHAIHLANDTHYGLTAGVISENLHDGIEVARRLRTGIVHVNDQTLNNDAYAPFGGTGASGNGSRFGSQSSWDEFTQWQWVTARPQAHGFPF